MLPVATALLSQSFYVYFSANVDTHTKPREIWNVNGFPHLAAQFERVDLLPLLAQGLVHATKVVAHHAQLVFVAPLRRSQLVLRERPQCQLGPAAAAAAAEKPCRCTCKRVMFWLARLTSSPRDSLDFSAIANLLAKARHWNEEKGSSSTLAVTQV